MIEIKNTELCDLLPDDKAHAVNSRGLRQDNNAYLSLTNYLLLADLGFLTSGGLAYAAGPPYNQICAIPLLGVGIVLAALTGLLAVLGKTAKK